MFERQLLVISFFVLMFLVYYIFIYYATRD